MLFRPYSAETATRQGRDLAIFLSIERRCGTKGRCMYVWLPCFGCSLNALTTNSKCVAHIGNRGGLQFKPVQYAQRSHCWVFSIIYSLIHTLLLYYFLLLFSSPSFFFSFLHHYSFLLLWFLLLYLLLLLISFVYSSALSFVYITIAPRDIHTSHVVSKTRSPDLANKHPIRRRRLSHHTTQYCSKMFLQKLLRLRYVEDLRTLGFCSIFFGYVLSSLPTTSMGACLNGLVCSWSQYSLPFWGQSRVTTPYTYLSVALNS